MPLLYRTTAKVESLENRQLFATSALAVPGGVDPSRFYLVGNSMTEGLILSGIYKYLSRHGDSTLQGRQSSGGRTISQLYHLEPSPFTSGFDPARPTEGNPWGDYTTAFTNPWDVLTLQPHDRRHLTHPVNGREEGEVPSILEWMHALSANSPNGQVFLYSRPLRMGDTPKPFDYSREWVKDYVDTGPNASRNFYSRSSVTQLMSKVRAAQIDDPVAKQMPLVKLIPIGEVYYVLDQMIKSGRFEGTAVTSLVQFYHDGSHPAYDLGSYAFALTFNASLTGDDPRGIAPNSSYLPGGTLLHDLKIQSLIQEAVYQAMHFPGYAGWLTTAGEGIASPGTLRVNVLNDAGVGVSGEAVFLDLDGDGIAGENEPIALTDTSGRATFDGIVERSYDVRSGETLIGVDIVAGRLTEANLTVPTSTQPALVATDEPGTLRVRVFTDANLNGRLDEGESLLNGNTLFVDLDRDGTLDTNESAAVADGNGLVEFTGLAPGNYSIGMLAPGNQILTTSIQRDAWVLAGGVRQITIGLIDRPLISIGVGTSGISGHVYNDLNANATRTSNEPGLAGQTVWVDLNLDGIRDASEPTAITDAEGRYDFTNIPANTYLVRAVVPEGWTQTRPGAVGGVLVSVGAAQSRQADPILIAEGVFEPPPVVVDSASIKGRTYNDNNRNGVFDVGDVLITGKTVFLDANNNGQLDTGEIRVLSGGNGEFTFAALPAGTHRVRRVFPSGYTYSNLPINLTLAPGQTYVGADIGSTPAPFTPVAPPVPTTGSATVHVYQDSDASGDLDDADTLLPNVRVYLDANDNGRFDAGEVSALTDADGVATFGSLPAGSVRFRVDAAGRYVPATDGAIATIVAGESTRSDLPVITVPVGTIRVTVFNDVDDDDQFTSTDSLLPNVHLYLDQNDNGEHDAGEPTAASDAAGIAVFGSVPAGTYRVRPILTAGYTASFTLDTQSLGESQTLELQVGLVAPPAPVLGSISGFAFNDVNRNGLLDAGELRTSGKKIFLDANNNGSFDTGELTRTTDSQGAYTFSDLPEGLYRVRRIFPTGYTYSNWAINLNLLPGQIVTGANIGSTPTPFTPTDPTDPPPPPPPPPVTTGSISGVLYNDNNTNGLYDAGDTPISRVVFLDTNRNDKLDSGEPQTKSASNGTFTFANLAAGEYRVRRVFPNGYTASNPPRDYTLAAGQSVTGADIGSVATGTVVTGTPTDPTPPAPTPAPVATGRISGYLFWDTNGNSRREDGESYQSGKTVYIDANDNDRLDAGERSTTSGYLGAFSFSDLSSGTFSVKRVLPNGYTTSTPTQRVTLTQGELFSDVVIGTTTASYYSSVWVRRGA